MEDNLSNGEIKIMRFLWEGVLGISAEAMSKNQFLGDERVFELEDGGNNGLASSTDID